MSLNYSGLALRNQDLFGYYSEGGYGNFPTPLFDDMKTTDQILERRILKPSQTVTQYMTDINSSYNLYSRKRSDTAGEEMSKLQAKGFKLLHQEDNGEDFSIMASIPDSSGYISTYDSKQDTHQFLWILIGVGFLAFIVNVMTPTE